MHIRTFQAPTLQEALAEIRRQMGSDATVLHTRDVHRGIFGLLGRSHVEVTAGLKPKTAVQRTTSRPVTAPIAAVAPVATTTAPRAQIDKSPQPQPLAQVQHLTEQVSRLSKVVHALEQANTTNQSNQSNQKANAPVAATSSNRKQPQDRVANCLIDLGLDAGSAQWIASDVSIDDSVTDENLATVLRQVLRKRFRTTGPIDVPHDRQRIVALVGPTGVGKTTTVAKLAAGFRLLEKRTVGLITIDTFRIAAVDQLHKYAQVMQLPMEVVSNGDEMRSAIQRLSDVDLILIDTVGRSPRDLEQLEITRKLLSHAQPDETHLVLSATSSRTAIESALQNFAVLSPKAVIISKLDEVQRQPDLLSLSAAGVPPISYVTTGQNVPDDIDLPQPSRLVDLALGRGDSHPRVHHDKTIDVTADPLKGTSVPDRSDKERPEEDRPSATTPVSAAESAEEPVRSRNLLLPAN